MNTEGSFVWYELMTTDTEAAEAFYRDVVGWGAADAGVPDISYTLFSAGEGPVAGMMALPKEACDSGARPGWMGYVAVGDVDASAAEVTRAGGNVHRPPNDIPGVGRFAIVADPQGATLALFKAVQECEGPPPAQTALGHGRWHELHAGDWETAFAFYSSLFGWTKDEPFDMGPWASTSSSRRTARPSAA